MCHNKWAIFSFWAKCLQTPYVICLWMWRVLSLVFTHSINKHTFDWCRLSPANNWLISSCSSFCSFESVFTWISHNMNFIVRNRFPSLVEFVRLEMRSFVAIYCPRFETSFSVTRRSYLSERSFFRIKSAGLPDAKEDIRKNWRGHKSKLRES